MPCCALWAPHVPLPWATAHRASLQGPTVLPVTRRSDRFWSVLLDLGFPQPQQLPPKPRTLPAPTPGRAATSSSVPSHCCRWTWRWSPWLLSGSSLLMSRSLSRQCRVHSCFPFVLHDPQTLASLPCSCTPHTPVPRAIVWSCCFCSSVSGQHPPTLCFQPCVNYHLTCRKVPLTVPLRPFLPVNPPLLLLKGPICSQSGFVSWSHCSKGPQPGDLKLQKHAVLTVLGARRPRARCPQGWFFLEEDRYMHFLAMRMSSLMKQLYKYFASFIF